MPGQCNYPAYLAGRTLFEQPATVRPAALFTDGTYPYLVVDPVLVPAGEEVQGVLVHLRPEHFLETLQRIDGLEDYKPWSPWSLYLRVSHPVATSSDTLDAWTYIAGPRIADRIRAGYLARVPRGRWSQSYPASP